MVKTKKPKAMEKPADGQSDASARGLADRVATSIGTRIVQGTYLEGETLPTETELANEHQVGRNAIREAVRTLVSKGFLKTERRAGTIVRTKKNWSVLDPDVMTWMLSNEKTRAALLEELTELRMVIEPQVAALAARKATRTDVLRIFEAYEDMEANANDIELAIRADMRFHETVFNATHNLLISNYSSAIFALLKANFELSIQAGNAFIRNLDDHREIAEAIHAGDPGAAFDATMKLLKHNASDIEQMLGTEAADVPDTA